MGPWTLNTHTRGGIVPMLPPSHVLDALTHRGAILLTDGVPRVTLSDWMGTIVMDSARGDWGPIPSSDDGGAIS